MWDLIIPVLAQRYQIKCINPPWVKESEITASLDDIENYTEELALSLSELPTKIVAWSMGGLIAIHIAKKFPQLIKQIILISSVPQFVSTNEFRYGINKTWFDKFILDFRNNSRSTFGKFIALQAKGDEYQMSTLRFLKQNCVFDNFDIDECLRGLELLQQQQLNHEFQVLNCKRMFIHGDKDTVLPIASAQFVAQQTNCELKIIENAGHAPQISHPDLTARLLLDTLNDAAL